MRAIDRFALSFSPICLRLILGITFLWSGAGKLFTTAELTPEQRVVLEQIETRTPPVPSPEELDPAAPAADPDIERLPEPDADAEAETPPPPAPGSERLRSLTDPPNQSAALPAGYSITLAQSEPPNRELNPDADPDPIEEEAEDAEDAFEEAGREIDQAVDDVERAVNPREPRRLVSVAFTIEGAVNPDRGNPRLPGIFLTYAMPLAWAVAIIEFLGGLCLLIGFLTRFWAVMLTGVAAGIVWITSLGPAALGGIDNAFLGFLPPLWPFDPAAVMQFLWTMALFFVALATIFLGAGALSIDRLLFGNPLKRYTYVKREPSYDVNPD